MSSPRTTVTAVGGVAGPLRLEPAGHAASCSAIFESVSSIFVRSMSEPLRLKAVALDMLPDQLLDLIDVLLILRFGASARIPAGRRRAAGVGDVLVVSPQAIEPAAQFVDQIVIMIFDAPRLAEMFIFLVHRH